LQIKVQLWHAFVQWLSVIWHDRHVYSVSSGKGFNGVFGLLTWRSALDMMNAPDSLSTAESTAHIDGISHE